MVYCLAINLNISGYCFQQQWLAESKWKPRNVSKNNFVKELLLKIII